MPSNAGRMLEVAARQFAEKGYSGASMRSIALETGTTQAAIYHHYPNKDALYQAVLERHFVAATTDMFETLASIKNARDRLQAFVKALAKLVAEDEQFRQLYFRELLEGDDKRLAFLAKNVFGDMVELATGLVEDLALEMDSHQVVLSIAGLVCHHVESRKLIRHLPDCRPENQDLDVIATHISQLLEHGLR